MINNASSRATAKKRYSTPTQLQPIKGTLSLGSIGEVDVLLLDSEYDLNTYHPHITTVLLPYAL